MGKADQKSDIPSDNAENTPEILLGEVRYIPQESAF